MNILLVSNKFPYPPKDGGAIATLNMALGFSKNGHKITILAMNTSKHPCKISEIPKDINDKINFISFEINIDINIWKAAKNLFFSKMPYNAERFVNKQFENLIIQTINSQKFDVIQLEGLYLTPYINTIKANSDALISLRAHNIEHEIWQRTYAQQKNPFKRNYIKILANRIKEMETKVLNKYEVLVPITDRDARVFVNLGNEKPIHVSSTGYDAEDYPHEPDKIEYPSLFHLGALDWSPNQEGLVWFIDNCWPILHKKNPTLKFYIAGRNAPSWFIDTLKHPNIEYCGEVHNSCNFMNSKAVMIVPLLSGSGIRIKIVEGMTLGKTIVTTSIGTEGIETTHNKNILIANSPETFVEEVEKAISNRAFFDEIGKNAREFITRSYNNVHITKKLADFYKNQKLARYFFRL